MGSDHPNRTRLVAHCCQGASFGFGLVVTVLTLAVMFWIAWCYFGLAILQTTNTQRRAVVNYSYTTPKPSPSLTSSPVRSTTVTVEETSFNSISKLPTTASVLRGASRGESPVKVDTKKDTSPVPSSSAKGDFATRDRPVHSGQPSESQDNSESIISPPRGPPRLKDEPLADSRQKAAILSGSSSEELDDDRIYARRVLPAGPENRPEEKTESDIKNIRRTISESEPNSRLDILPTKVYDTEGKSGSSRRPQDSDVDQAPTDDGKSKPRDYIDRDKILPSRRDEIPRSDSEPVYREPDFDRESNRRYASDADRDRGRPRYDDLDDERGSRSRYDKRDRGRDSDDRYSKGDTRVYPEDRPVIDDRYRERVRDRYPEDDRRRGDDDRYDDRYRDYEEKPRYRDAESDRRDRDSILRDRTSVRDDRYKDDDRYRSDSEGRYRSRDEDGYRYRDDERYRFDDKDRNRSRSEDRYVNKDDDRYRARDVDRYKDDDRYSRDPIAVDRKDSTTRYQDEERYRPRTGEDKYVDISPSRSRDPDYSDRSRRYDDERDRYRSRTDDDRYDDRSPSRSRDRNFREPEIISSDMPERDRKLSSSRSEYDGRIVETVSDYDLGVRESSKSYGRNEQNSNRNSRPVYDDDRYRDERIPSRYQEDDKRISPTRAIGEDSNSRSSLVDTRPKVITGDTRYIPSEIDSRRKEDRYYDQEDKIRSSKVQDFGVAESRDTSRRQSDNRDEYRTSLPNERTKDREEVMLDRRSYASEEEDDYRRKNTRSDYDYEERSRKPSEETRRRNRDDERYIERDRIADDAYKREQTRSSYGSDSVRSRDRYSDDTRRYDDRNTRDDDRYVVRDDKYLPLPPRKYYDEEEIKRSRDPEPSTMRKEDSVDRSERPRSRIPSSEDRYYSRDEYPEPKPSSRRRYDDEPLPDSRDYKDDYQDDRRRTGSSRIQENAKDPMVGSSMTSVHSREPSDIVVREKRFQNADNRPQSSRVYASDDTSTEKSYLDSGSDSRSRDSVRPLSQKDVIETAMRHSDSSNQNARKVLVQYPVFDPRISNLTSPEIIRPSERRGTTINAKRRRSA